METTEETFPGIIHMNRFTAKNKATAVATPDIAIEGNQTQNDPLAFDDTES